MRRFALALMFAATLFSTTPAQAYVTDGLYLYMDARDTNSYSVANPTQWNDISPNLRNGTIHGSVTLDNATDALFFDGSSSGTNYVDLSGEFNDWGDGFTIEFIGEFGARVDNWERIFDFGNGPESDNVWVGRFTNTQNLTIEIWDGSTNLGRCHTTGNQLAGRTIHHWIITMDSTPTCRIYMDGAEVETVLSDRFEVEVTTPSTNGTVYPGLPNDVTRTNNYVGASNWTDPDFEGSIQMVRIYTRPLTVDEVQTADETTPDGGTDGGGGDTGGEESGGGTDTGSLASTGFDPISLGGLSLLAMAAGIVIARRRTRRSQP
jgi:hypothetical protein